MLAAIFEVLFQFIFELILEIVAEILSEFGLRGFDRARKAAEQNPLISGIGYVILGLALGGLSCLIFPNNIIQNETMRIANRFLSPIFLGFMLCLVSWIISRRQLGEKLLRLDKFIFGVVFGIAYSISRFALM